MLGSFKKLFVGAATTAALFLGATAQAGFVDLGNAGWRASWPNSLDSFLQIVVDGEDANAVYIQKIAQFVGAPGPGGLIDPYEVTFTQTAANAKPNIVIISEAITNQNGVPWLDFHFDLVDSGNATFNVAATAASGGPGPIGFNISPFTTAVFGPSSSGPNTRLDLAGGAVLPGQTWFPGTGPGGNGDLWITAVPQTSAPFTVFTLKERPTIPEPSSLALLAIGGLALVRRNRK